MANSNSSGKDSVNAVEGRRITVNKNVTKTYTTDTNTSFPYNLPAMNNSLFAIVFQCYKFSRPSILVGANLIPYGSIALPLPSDLVDRATLSYSEEKLGLATGSALLAAENTFNSQNGSLSDRIAAAGEALATGAVNVGTAIGAQKVGEAVNKFVGGDVSSSIVKATSALTGVVQNPFLTVLFNSPAFKRHMFSWNLIPETAQDSENLNFILNKLRFHAHPGINGGVLGTNVGENMLLSYPDMIKPTLLPAGFLYDLKYCVIENMSVDYAPGSLPSFFPTNGPSAIRLSLSLLEIEFWTQGDFDGSNKSRKYLSNR